MLISSKAEKWSKFGVDDSSGRHFQVYDENNNEINFINTLIQNGVNTIRLRLWVNPADESSSLNEVKEFSDELKSLGFKIWITPHFSDTWAHILLRFPLI